jgi:hypothetical protein
MGRPLALKAVRRRYWELVGEGVAPWTAAARLGVSDTTGGRWFRHAGGVKPQFSDAGGTKWQRLSPAEQDLDTAADRCLAVGGSDWAVHRSRPTVPSKDGVTTCSEIRSDKQQDIQKLPTLKPMPASPPRLKLPP